MSFAEIIRQFHSFDIDQYCNSVTPSQIDTILRKPVFSTHDFAALLSDAATSQLEVMAQQAVETTKRHFGSAITLFTPMYISSYCTNNCPYCSFSSLHSIKRSHLSPDEIEIEAAAISAKGIRHVLILTGEAPQMVPLSYLESAIAAAKKHFASVAIEVFPMNRNQYQQLIVAGSDMLTLYQETYNQTRYEELHTKGPKSNYHYRLDTPQRACEAGMRSVTVGALHGLDNWRSEAFFTGLHAAYLQKKFPEVDVAVSFPRLRPLAGSFTPFSCLDDRHFVQVLTATRLFLPSAGITMSTRESADFRMSVLPLGVTRMSAGVSTSVGGHTGNNSTPQFEIADTRSVDQICSDLSHAGFQPVMHDWNTALVT